jgi:hypothetical protein
VEIGRLQNSNEMTIDQVSSGSMILRQNMARHKKVCVAR